LFVIARSRHQQQILNGGVVGTLMSNYGLEKAFSQLKIPFARAKVGDRYVLELMQKNEWLLGGESSGHIICLDRTTTGDGIVSAVQVLATIVKSGCSLNELKAGMRKMPQVMINVKTKTKIDVNKNQDIQAAVRSVESRLQDNGRVLLRPSGTEPLIRVMVEGADLVEVDGLARELAAKVEDAVRKAS
jgi:phosphoglucosamine mutase